MSLSPTKIAVPVLFIVSALTAYHFTGDSADKAKDLETVDSRRAQQKTASPFSPQTGNIAQSKQEDSSAAKETEASPLTVEEESEALTEISNTDFIWVESEEAQKYLEEQDYLPVDFTEGQFIELDQEKISNLKVGGSFKMNLPNVGEIATEINNVKVSATGNRVIRASIIGGSETNSALITVGKKHIYGDIYTDKGSYVLRGKDGYAYLASKNSLQKNHYEDDAESLGKQKQEEEHHHH